MITFENVYKSFGKHTVLNGLDLTIPKGSITFVIGKSGEGKSVTIKHMMGLLQPDRGSIVIDGEEITSYNLQQMHHLRKKFGILFQHAALFDSMTVGENIAFPLVEQTQLSKSSQTERVAEVLAQCGLSGLEEAYPDELSTGEKKRVGLARALAPHPKILLYDEPTTGMDPLISEMIDELIVQVSKEDPELTSVVISHDLKAAMNTAHQIMMLYEGKLALGGSPQDFKDSKDPVIRQFFSGKTQGPMKFF